MNFSGTIDFRPKLLSALRNYSASRFKDDLIAGIVVGIVALPLAIAFGIASGVSPTVGLITAIIGGFMVSAFGGNSVQIGGPTGAFIVIVYNIIAIYGLQGLAIATFIAGLILVTMGLFRLGTVIKFIPYPIVVGFTAGIALTIFHTNQRHFRIGINKRPQRVYSEMGSIFPKLRQYRFDDTCSRSDIIAYNYRHTVYFQEIARSTHCHYCNDNCRVYFMNYIS